MWFNDRFQLELKIAVVLIATSLLGACGEGSKQQAEKKSQGVGTVQSDAKGPAFTVQINSAPLFESQQGWSDGYTKATGHGPGVVVGPGATNPNVFAQRFPAKPNDQFRVIARASSVDKPKAMGRIQINWAGPEGKFISVASRSFEVTPTEQTFDLLVVAPPGVESGTLYVVADGTESVVRYTEMRLLGKEGSAVKAK